MTIDVRGTRVKICGLTSPADAVRAVELGADYLGLNFYPGSPRCLTIESAREIARAVAGRRPLVGVFAGATHDEIAHIDCEVGLDLLQFHGDEGVEEVTPFADRAIKVFRVRDELDEGEIGRFENCWGFLFDSYHEGLLGGTGESWSWGLARSFAGRKPLFVAGGITPETARRATEVSGAWALDVCSGVESSPGRKDWGKMERLFEVLAHGD